MDMDEQGTELYVLQGPGKCIWVPGQGPKGTIKIEQGKLSIFHV